MHSALRASDKYWLLIHTAFQLLLSTKYLLPYNFNHSLLHSAFQYRMQANVIDKKINHYNTAYLLIFNYVKLSLYNVTTLTSREKVRTTSILERPGSLSSLTSNFEIEECWVLRKTTNVFKHAENATNEVLATDNQSLTNLICNSFLPSKSP